MDIYTTFYSCPSDTNLFKGQQLLEEKLWFDFQWIRVCLILNLFSPLSYGVLHKYHLCHHHSRHPYGPSESSSCSQWHFIWGFIILILKMRKWKLREFKWSAQVHAVPERHRIWAQDFWLQKHLRVLSTTPQLILINVYELNVVHSSLF